MAITGQKLIRIFTSQLKLKRMEKYQLDNEHYMFGGKGDVWSNTAHIAKSGEPVTMCGRPMLSSNWVAMEGMEHIGCPKCVAKYQQLEADKCVMA